MGRCRETFIILQVIVISFCTPVAARADLDSSEETTTENEEPSPAPEPDSQPASPPPGSEDQPAPPPPTSRLPDDPAPAPDPAPDEEPDGDPDAAPAPASDPAPDDAGGDVKPPPPPGSDDRPLGAPPASEPRDQKSELPAANEPAGAGIQQAALPPAALTSRLKGDFMPSSESWRDAAAKDAAPASDAAPGSSQKIPPESRDDGGEYDHKQQQDLRQQKLNNSVRDLVGNRSEVGKRLQLDIRDGLREANAAYEAVMKARAEGRPDREALAQWNEARDNLSNLVNKATEGQGQRGADNARKVLEQARTMWNKEGERAREVATRQYEKALEDYVGKDPRNRSEVHKLVEQERLYGDHADKARQDGNTERANRLEAQRMEVSQKLGATLNRLGGGDTPQQNLRRTLLSQAIRDRRIGLNMEQQRQAVPFSVPSRSR